MGWSITILGIILIGIGSFFTYYGQNIVKNETYKITNVSKKILSPQAEKLLSLIYKYQKEFGENKLIISRNGVLHFDESDKRGKYKINVIGEIYDINSNFSSREKEFDALMLSIPTDFLKNIPEGRYDSPYVVKITDEGIAYLKNK